MEKHVGEKHGGTQVDKEKLKEWILREVQEFRNAKTREEKQKIMEKRKIQEIMYNMETLKKILDEYDILDTYFNIEDVDFTNITPQLVFCNTPKYRMIWLYFRSIVSSHPYTGYWGRRMDFLLMDKNSNCVLGIIGLGSDFMSLKARDNYIGWTNKDKSGFFVWEKDGTPYSGVSPKSYKRQKRMGLKKVGNKLRQLMNIYVCVPTYPFGLLAGGKLLAMLCFSNEVLEMFEKLYGEKLVGITTTSLYGKSIQYDKIPQFLKFLGYSYGIGNIQFSRPLVEKIREYFNENLKERFTSPDGFFDLGLQPKAKMISFVCKDLGLSSSVLNHGHKRGVYFGFCYKNSREYLTSVEVYPNGRVLDDNERFKLTEEQKKNRGVKLKPPISENELIPFENRTLNDIFEYWIEKFFYKRLTKLTKINFDEIKRKYNINIYNNQFLISDFVKHPLLIKINK